MLVWLFLFLCWLYSFVLCNNIQSLGAFDLIAFIFKMSPLCIKPFIPDVIHGELRARTRFVLSGACLLAMAKRSPLALYYVIDCGTRVEHFFNKFQRSVITWRECSICLILSLCPKLTNIFFDRAKDARAQD